MLGRDACGSSLLSWARKHGGCHTGLVGSVLHSRRGQKLLGSPSAAGPEAPTGWGGTVKPGVFPVDPDEARHATRRMRKAANRLSQPQRLLVLDCQGRGCRRKLGQVLTHPPGGGTTPDGVIEPTKFTDGPVLEVWGPFETAPRSGEGDFVLRGTKASITAPKHTITLRGRWVLPDGSIDPTELPLGPGRSITIVCGCGHSHVVSLSDLSASVELVRNAIDDY